MTCAQSTITDEKVSLPPPLLEVIGWYPTAGVNRGRILAMYATDFSLTINIVFWDGRDVWEYSTITLDRTSPRFKSLFRDAENYTGPVGVIVGRLMDFDFMKIEVEMTPEGDAPWFLRSKLVAVKIIPWPVWWDNRPARQRGKK